MVEQFAVNEKVAGSNPASGATLTYSNFCGILFFMNDIEPSSGESPREARISSEMPEAASQELEMLGLSPDFPEKVHALNISLAESIGNYRSNFAGYKFVLSPDYSRPVVEAQQKYVYPFGVEIDVSPDRRAVLAIEPKQEGAVLAAVRLDQLQAIFAEANVGFFVKVFEPLSERDVDFIKPLDELTEEELVKVSPSSAIVISAESKPEGEVPMRFEIQAKQMNERGREGIIPTLRIEGLRIEGPPDVVEGSLDTVARLATTIHFND